MGGQGVEESERRVSVEAFRLEARRWLASQDFPVIPEDPDARLAMARAWQAHLKQHGWMGLSWPTEYGGRGLTLLHQTAFNQELALAGGPSTAGAGATDVLGQTILAFGSEEQKRRLLPKMLSGDDLWCQGFSEPDSGSDLASLSTSAKIAKDEFIINGRKIWSTRGHVADWCALLARTDPDAPVHKGISYLLLRMDTPGISARPIRQLNGECDFAEILFDDVHVSRDAILGELNQGWSYAMHTLASERGCFVLRKVTDLSVDFDAALAELSAGGSSINDLDMMRLGEIDADLFALRSQADAIADRLNQNMKSGDTSDSFDKVTLTMVEQKLFRVLREMLGRYANVGSRRPRGLNASRLIQRYYYSRAASIYGGSAQIQRNIIGERTLGLPREQAR
jgi:alkylation response protein AidB-like acyl-CoA dehydrogenase